MMWISVCSGFFGWEPSPLRCGDRGQVPLETVWWEQEVKEQTGRLFLQWLNQLH